MAMDFAEADIFDKTPIGNILEYVSNNTLPYYYTAGMNISISAPTHLLITAGACRDSTNTYSIAFESDVTINASTTGLNALDTGTLSASTTYYIYAIGGIINSEAFSGAIISLNGTAPTYPAGYTYCLKRGTATTNGSTVFTTVVDLVNPLSRNSPTFTGTLTGTTASFTNLTATNPVNIPNVSNSWWVSNKQTGTGNGSAENRFATITEAQNAAAAGDIIYIDSGTYTVPALYKNNIQWVGVGNTILSGTSLDLNNTLWTATTNPYASFKGFVFVVGGINFNPTTLKASSSVLFENCTLLNAPQIARIVDVTLVNCTIDDIQIYYCANINADNNEFITALSIYGGDHANVPDINFIGNGNYWYDVNIYGDASSTNVGFKETNASNKIQTLTYDQTSGLFTFTFDRVSYPTTVTVSSGTGTFVAVEDFSTILAPYALSSAVVHNTGNESVAGTKTFTSPTLLKEIQNPFPYNITVSTISSTSATITATQLVTGCIAYTGAGDGVLTLPLATDIETILTTPAADRGLRVRIENQTDYVLQILANTGTTLTGLSTSGILIIPSRGSTLVELLKLATNSYTLSGGDPGYSIINYTGTAKTFALTDRNSLQRCNNASTQTLTIPLNSSVAFPIGTIINIAQIGAGQVVIAATGGVTINSKLSNLKISAQYAGATLTKTLTDTWLLVGDLAA